MSKFPYKIKGKVPAVEVIASSQSVSQEFEFIVDTGASECTISLRAAEGLGFDMNAITEIGPRLYTASDVVYPKSITLASFGAFGHSIQDYRIRVVNFPDDTDGVVGMDFISQFRRFTINIPDDPDNATIEVGRLRKSLFSIFDLADIVTRVVLMRRNRL